MLHVYLGEIPRLSGRNSPSIWEKFPVYLGEIPRLLLGEILT